MTRARKKIQSSMGWSNESSITVQGLDLSRDILGKLNLGDFAFLEIKRRTPTPQESLVFNAVLGTLVEHGMTPMVIAARLTYLGAPESLQGAVAAGILGMGTTFAGTAEGSARLLQEAIRPDTMPRDLPALADEIVARHIASKTSIPGIGHNLHKPIDPRTPRLFQLAQENGLCGRYVELMKLVASAAERGAERALACLGLENGHAAADIRDLRGLIDAWREARRTAWQTTVKVLTTGVLAALLVGVAIKLRLMGGPQ